MHTGPICQNCSMPLDTAADFATISGLPLRIVRTHLSQPQVGSQL